MMARRWSTLLPLVVFGVLVGFFGWRLVLIARAMRRI